MKAPSTIGRPATLRDAGAAWLYHDLFGHQENSAPWAKLTATQRTPWLDRRDRLTAWMRECGFPIARNAS